jgi:hypothetical protein
LDERRSRFCDSLVLLACCAYAYTIRKADHSSCRFRDLHTHNNKLMSRLPKLSRIKQTS